MNYCTAEHVTCLSPRTSILSNMGHLLVQNWIFILHFIFACQIQLHLHSIANNFKLWTTRAQKSQNFKPKIVQNINLHITIILHSIFDIFTIAVYVNFWIPRASTIFFVVSVLLVFLLFVCVVQLCVFMFWVPNCDVRYDFRIKTIFGSSLLPFLCIYIIYVGLYSGV